MSEGLRNLRLVFMLLVSLALVSLAPFVGLKWISPVEVFSGGNEAGVFWRLRWPRTMLAFLAGAGLSAAGMAFQALFRNALATPFTLGVSSGASLGAALYLLIGLPVSILGIPGISLAAFVGAAVAVGLVWSLSSRASLAPGAMLLAGVAVSFFFSSFLLAAHYAADMTHSFQIFHWLMGSLETVGMDGVAKVLPFVLLGSMALALRRRELDLFLAGDEIAQSRGVSGVKVRFQLFVAVSAMVGGVVAICGPIGFVGMMVPHICRMLLGAHHRFLLPASLVCGGAFLAVCDALGRALLAPAEIPVGVVTALLGGPFFLWLLVRRGRLQSGAD